MPTRTSSGKTIRDGKNWSKRVVAHLIQDETLVAMARQLTLANVAQDGKTWHACYVAVLDRVKELVYLPGDCYDAIMVSNVCGVIRRGEL